MQANWGDLLNSRGISVHNQYQPHMKVLHAQAWGRLFQPGTQSSCQEESKFRDSLHERIPRSDTKVEFVEYDQIEYIIMSVRIEIGFEKIWKASDCIVVGCGDWYLRVVVGSHYVS